MFRRLTIASIIALSLAAVAHVAYRPDPTPGPPPADPVVTPCCIDPPQGPPPIDPRPCCD